MDQRSEAERDAQTIRWGDGVREGICLCLVRVLRCRFEKSKRREVTYRKKIDIVIFLSLPQVLHHYYFGVPFSTKQLLLVVGKHL